MGFDAIKAGDGIGESMSPKAIVIPVRGEVGYFTRQAEIGGIGVSRRIGGLAGVAKKYHKLD